MDLFDDEEKKDVGPLMEETPAGTESSKEGSLHKQEIKKKHIIYSCIIVAIVLVLIASSISIGIFIGANMGIKDDMPMMVEAYELVKKYYYKDISWDEFQEIATINAMDSLDPFTFITGTGEVPTGKIGIMIASDKINRHMISFIYPGSGAMEAKAMKIVDQKTLEEKDIEDPNKQYPLEIGDEIYAIYLNGEWQQVVGASSATLRNYINQAEGNIVKLRMIKHNKWYSVNGSDVNGDKLFYFDYYIVKKDFLQQTAYYMSPSEIANEDERQDVAYIKFFQFDESAIADFYQCMREFLLDPEKPTKLILDLRSNGGGRADVLAFIASYFIESSTPKQMLVTSSKQNNGKFQDEALFTNPHVVYQNNELEAVYINNLIPNFEINILVDGSSASSSEVLAANLMFYSGAKIVGQTTFGKGVAQKVFPLSGGKYSIAITNGKYYLPSYDASGNIVFETNIHGIGLTPEGDNLIKAEEPKPIKKDSCVRRALKIFGE